MIHGLITMGEAKLGATGEFPRGKIAPEDEGELTIAIGAWRGIVRIDFGKRITWVGMPPEQAREMARRLIKHADEIEGHLNDDGNAE